MGGTTVVTRRQWLAAEGLGFLACVLPIAFGVVAFTRSSSVGSDRRPVVSRVGLAAVGRHLPDSLLHGVIELAPFRLVRRPAVASYEIGRPDLQVEAPPSTKPTLVLSGIITGRHPAALLDGVPGRDGSVLLELGDTVAGLQLRRVEEGQVVITGMDTTWTLTLRKRWNQ